MIRFNCDCGRELQGRSEDVGRAAKCPACGTLVTIPSGDAAPSEAVTSRPPAPEGVQTGRREGDYPDREPDRRPLRREGGGSDWIAPFTWGFVLGVLVCLGVGGGFYFFVVQRQHALAAEAAMMEAMLREEQARAEEARRHAEENAARARADFLKAREAMRKQQEGKRKE